MIPIVLVNALDLATFALAVSVHPIDGEGNPLARQLYAIAGLPGVAALKVAGVLLILVVLSGIPDSPGKTVATAILVALPLLGALSNAYAYSLAR